VTQPRGGILGCKVEGAAPGTDEQFAEWYVWAKREVSSDPRVCLGVAQAAIEALAGGADRPAAELAARRSVAGIAVVLLSHVTPRRQAYAEWYDWARLEFGGDKERLHRITRAVVQCLETGGNAAEAVDVARSLARADQPPEPEVTQAAPAPQPAMVPPPLPAGQVSAPVAPPPSGPAPMPAPAPAAAAAPSVVVAPPPRTRQASLPAAWPEPRPAAQQGVADLIAYGGFWRRVAAFLVDMGMGLVGAVVVYLVVLMVLVSNPRAIGAIDGILLASLAALVVLFWVYFAGLESSPWQATVGKRAMGLIVTDTAGRQISFARATGRHFAKFLSLILVGTGFFMIGLSRYKQGLHDKVAGTLVVRRRYLSRVLAQRSEAASGRVPAEFQQRA
jgi:uncharacterized RDD family membrane protein YckC